MPARIEPFPVLFQEWAFELALRHLETRQVAFSSFERRQRLDSSPVAQLDRRRLKLVDDFHQAFNGKAMAGMQTQARMTVGPQAFQFFLELGPHALERRHQAALDTPNSHNTQLAKKRT